MEPKLRFKEFTDDWEEKKLEEISKIKTGGTPKTSIKAYWDKKEIPWMASGEINNIYIYKTKDIFIKQISIFLN